MLAAYKSSSEEEEEEEEEENGGERDVPMRDGDAGDGSGKGEERRPEGQGQNGEKLALHEAKRRQPEGELAGPLAGAGTGAGDHSGAEPKAKKPKLKLPRFGETSNLSATSSLPRPAAAPQTTKATTAASSSLHRKEQKGAGAREEAIFIPPQVRSRRKNVSTEDHEGWNSAYTARRMQNKQAR